MQPEFPRNWENIDRGASGNTIEMDDRFTDDKKLHASTQMLNESNIPAKYLEDLTPGDVAAEGLLLCDEGPKEELFGPDPK